MFGNPLYFPLNFAMNLKLPSKNCPLIFVFLKVKSQQLHIVLLSSSLAAPSRPPHVYLLLTVVFSRVLCFLITLKPQREKAAVLRILHIRLQEMLFHISCPMTLKPWATVSTCHRGCRLHFLQSELQSCFQVRGGLSARNFSSKERKN